MAMPIQTIALLLSEHKRAGMDDPPAEPLNIDFGRMVRMLGFGTLEHVFDIRQGLKNTADMLAPGGRVFHPIRSIIG